MTGLLCECSDPKPETRRGVETIYGPEYRQVVVAICTGCDKPRVTPKGRAQ